MDNLRPVSKLEKILFPIIVTIDRVPDPSDDSTACWYADARKPVPRERCGKTAL